MGVSKGGFLISLFSFLVFSSLSPSLFSQPHPPSSGERDTSSLRYRMLKEGHFHAHARSFFMATDNDKGLTDYAAWALGAGLSYESPVIRGFQFGITGFFIFNMSSTDLGKIDTTAKSGNRYELGLFDLTDPGNTSDLDRLEDLYVRYTWRKSKLEAGRFELNTPFINRQDGRMRGTIEQGAWLEMNEIKNLKIAGGWIYKISPRSTVAWYDVEDSYGVYPSGVNVYGAKSSYAGNIQSAGLALLGVSFKQNKWSVQVWEQFAENVFNTALIRTDLGLPLNKNTVLKTGLMYVRQDAVNYGGNEDQTKTYISKGSSSDVVSGQAGIRHGKFEASLNYTRIAKGSRFLMPREWGREPFYTFMPRERNEGYADVNAGVVRLSYDMLGGKLLPAVSYGHFYLPDVTHPAENKYGMPSYAQLNTEVRYVFDGYLKGMNVLLLMVYKNGLDEDLDAPRYVFNKVNMLNWNLVVDYTF